MKAFAFQMGSQIGVATCDDEGVVRLYRHFAPSKQEFVTEVSGPDTERVLRDATPVKGHVNDDLRMALQAACTALMKGAS